MNYITDVLKQFRKDIVKYIKIVMVIYGVCLALIVLFIVLLSIFREPYLSGRDTVTSFGSGRYQILGSTKGENTELSLYDCEDNIHIEEKIYKYSDEEYKGQLYVIGENGYTVLNYKKEKYKQDNSIENFSGEEQAIFKKIK